LKKHLLKTEGKTSPAFEDRNTTSNTSIYSVIYIYSTGGGFNPFEKYVCQIGSFPQVGDIKKKTWPPNPLPHQQPQGPKKPASVAHTKKNLNHHDFFSTKNTRLTS